MQDYINNFSTSGGMVNISNLQSGCGGGGYSNLTQLQQLHVNQGDTFGIAVQSGTANPQGFRIWIDWNQDGDFSGPDEAVWDSGVHGLQMFTGTVTVPPHAMPGITRMRVRSDYNKIPADPCAWQYYSETEDYAVVLTPFYNDDAGICEIVSPLPMDLSGLKQVSVRLTNFGSDTLTSVMVNWSVNGQLQPHFSWSGFLPTNASVAALGIGSYAFITGYYEIKVWTSSPNNQVDSFPMNDTVAASFYFNSVLGGVYTVGGPTADFEDLTKALTVLYFYGVNAPVVFSFDSLYGPYQGGHELTNVTGVSGTNSITFQGNGSVLKEGSTSYVLAINGLSYFTLDGFTIVNTDSATPRFCVAIRGGSQNIYIINNTIDAGIKQTSQASGGIIMSDSYTTPVSTGNNGHYVYILNNRILGGYYGISLTGDMFHLFGCSNFNQISNNTIRSFAYGGIHLEFNYGTLVEGNDISSPERSTLANFYGIVANYSQAIRIYSNNIHSGGSSYGSAFGIVINECENLPGLVTEIVNNVIYDFPRATYGISLNGWRLQNVNIYHNTVIIGSNGPVGTLRAVSIPGGYSAMSLNLFNNNLSITGSGSGTGHCLYMLYGSVDYLSDHNNYHVSFTNNATGYVIRYGQQDHNTLASWLPISGRDSMSVSIDPFVAQLQNGNLTPLSVQLDNLGVNRGVQFDFYGLPRNLNTPDIGAIEFLGYPTDLSVTGGRLKSGYCLSSNDSVYISVGVITGGPLNFATHPQTAHWICKGPVTSTGSITINSGNVNTGGQITVGGDGVNLSVPGEYTLDVWLSTSAFNLYAGNDTFNNVHKHYIRPALIFEPGKKIELSDINDSVHISVFSPHFPSSDFFITEISLVRGENGKPAGGWPHWMLTNVYNEITGMPYSDLAGISLELWNSYQLMLSHTFPQGTVLSPEGIAIVASISAASYSVPRPEFHYYHAYTNFGLPPTNPDLGWILRDSSGTIVDAVVNGSFVFPPASGVTPAHWQGLTPSIGYFSAGNVLNGPYTRDSSNWVDAGATGSNATATPHQLNPGVSLPALNAVPGLAWSHNGVVTSVNNQDTVVGPWQAPGTYRYAVQYSSQCGIISDSVTIIINPSGVKYSNDTTICEGDSLMMQITLPGTGPFTLLLSDGTTTDTIAGILSSPYTFYVQPPATTTYTFVGFADQTSTLLPLNLQTVVSVSPLPNVSFQTPLYFCEGSTGLLTGAIPAGGIWSGNYVTSGTSPSFLASAAGVGIHQVWYTYTDPSTGCAGTGELDVTVLPAPTVNPGPDQVICQNAGTVLSVNPGFQTYNWSTGDTTSSISVTGASIGAGNSMTFTITVTDNNGCEASDSVLVTVIDCSGIEMQAVQSGIRIVPNPSTGEFILEVRGIEGEAVLSIYSMTGETIYEKTLHLLSESQIRMNTGITESGIYLLRLITEKRVYTEMLIMKK